MWKQLLIIATLMSFLASTMAQAESRIKSASNLPQGYWPLEQSQPIIDKTQTIRLAPDLSHLSPVEREAVAKLLEAGKLFQSLYEDQRHVQALTSYSQPAGAARQANGLLSGNAKPAHALPPESGRPIPSLTGLVVWQ